MSCTHHRQVLGSWSLDDDLPDATALHLDVCPACTAVFDGFVAPVPLPVADAPVLESLLPPAASGAVPLWTWLAAGAGLVVAGGLALQGSAPLPDRGAVVPEPAPVAVEEPLAQEAPPGRALPTRSGTPNTGPGGAEPPPPEYPLRRGPLVDLAPPELDVTWILDQGDLEGDPTLVLFWSSGCQYCDGALRRAADLHGQRGLEVVGVTNETDPELALAYLEDVVAGGIPFPNALDSTGAAWSAWGITAVPAAVVVDEGVVVFAGHVPAAERFLDAQLGEPR